MNNSEIKQYYIDKVVLKNFMGFYGEHVFDISEQSGYRNILIYGENGSGKTSLYQGISGFFDMAKSHGAGKSKSIKDFQNIFATKDKITPIGSESIPIQDTRITLHFTSASDGNRIEGEWDEDSVGIVDKNLNSACTSAQIAVYNYSDILDVYYDFRRKDMDSIDIGGLIITRILIDYKLGNDTIEERIEKIRNQTNEIKKSLDTMNSLRQQYDTQKLTKLDYDELINEEESYHEGLINQRDAAIDDFNNLLQEALIDLQSNINELLETFVSSDSKTKNDDIRIKQLEYKAGLSVDNNHQIVYPTIIPVVSFFGQENKKFHIFLNEARISSIMMSILFAKYRMVPPAINEIKLLVLDDVLIGIDINNRFKVLHLLDKFFYDWQIVVMTYDQLWYEAVMRFSNLKWNMYEMHAHVENIPCPVVRKMSDNINSYIEYLISRADYYVNNNYDINAAGIYARISYETILKDYCVKKGISVQYKWNIGASYNMASDFETAINNYLADPNIKENKKRNMSELWEKLNQYKNITNQAAHSLDLKSKEEIKHFIKELKVFTSQSTQTRSAGTAGTPTSGTPTKAGYTTESSPTNDTPPPSPPQTQQNVWIERITTSAYYHQLTTHELVTHDIPKLVAAMERLIDNNTVKEPAILAIALCILIDIQHIMIIEPDYNIKPRIAFSEYWLTQNKHASTTLKHRFQEFGFTESELSRYNFIQAFEFITYSYHDITRNSQFLTGERITPFIDIIRPVE